MREKSRVFQDVQGHSEYHCVFCVPILVIDLV
jgi:hypothetical protein